MNSPTDTDLVLATRWGNKEAFGQLVERYLPMTRRVALRMIGDQEIAQELAQEAMLQAYLSLDKLREIDRFQSWLYGIVRNVCRNYLRSQRADFCSLDALSGGVEFPTLELEPQEVVEKGELHHQVQQAIDSLSPKNQAATRLFYYEQLSTHQIAAVLGTSVAAIKDRLYQSRKRLREQLTPVYAQMPNMLRFTESTGERKVAMVKITAVHAIQVENADHYILYLTDATSRRIVPIWVGLYEGHQIAQLLRGEETARPMPFHFVANLLDALNAKLQEVRVEALKDKVFYAVVKAHNGEGTQKLDARPVDAITLALYTDTPIFIAEGVMDKVARDMPEAVDEKAAVEELHRLAEEEYRFAREWKHRIQEGRDFTNSMLSVLTQMEEEALRLNHNYIGTEHVLLSLVRDREGSAGKVLRTVGIELDQVIEVVERLVGHGKQARSSAPILAPRVAQVIALAEEEMHQLGHASISTGHLLVGLIREGQGLGIAVLCDLGVDLDQVRIKALEFPPPHEE